MEESKWILGPGDGDSHPPITPSATVGFESLYRRFASRVNARILAIVGDPEEAAELSQEVFLRIHGDCSRGRVPENVGEWIERKACLAAKRHLARKAARPEIPLGAMPLSKRADPRPWANLDAAPELGWAV